MSRVDRVLLITTICAVLLCAMAYVLDEVVLR